MHAFPSEDETNFIITGSAGKLELLTRSWGEAARQNAVAIICHPHPLHGGTMNNKVVTTLARAFRDLGLRTVRFNFRGVGKSEGSFAEGAGEQEDLLAVMDWVKKVCPEADVWLAGFSFGAFVSAHVAAKVPVAQLVSVAPQVSRFIESKLGSITCPWILVQGEQDEVVSPEAVFTWALNQNPQPHLIRIPDAGHFFHGKLMELRTRLVSALSR